MQIANCHSAVPMPARFRLDWILAETTLIALPFDIAFSVTRKSLIDNRKCEAAFR
jgi:hypothetical protein